MKIYMLRCRNWIRCDFKGTGQIGLLLEKELNKQPDRYLLPDYNGIEIKTKSMNSKFGIKLFSCAFDSRPNEMLDFFNKAYYVRNNKRTFQLSINTKKGRIIDNGYIKIKSYDDNRIIKLLYYKENKLYTYSWSYSELKNRLYTKMKYLAIVKYIRKKYNNNIYVKFIDVEFYELLGFEQFLYCINEGYIRICFNLKEDYINNTKLLIDKGTGFEIEENKIIKLYKKKVI